MVSFLVGVLVLAVAAEMVLVVAAEMMHLVATERTVGATGRKACVAMIAETQVVPWASVAVAPAKRS